MKPINLLIVIGLAATGAARADSIIVVFDPVTTTGYVGSTVVDVVMGTIENTTSDDLGPIAFDIDVNTGASGIIVDTSVFDPPDVPAETTSAPFEMFTLDFSDVTVAQDYDLEVSIDDQVDVTNLEYEVDVLPAEAPEPGSLVMLSIGLGLAGVYGLRRLSCRSSRQSLPNRA